MSKKTRDEAIDYLKGKGEFESKKYKPKEIIPVEDELVKKDEAKIEKVMKKGKLYGDPLVEIEV